MKEKTTSKQSSLLTSDEIFVAQILLDLPSMIRTFESGSSLKWGSKKRRSGFNESSISPSSFQKTEERRWPQSKAAAAEVAATASPVTPLAFSPSESDEKSRNTSKTNSRKRSRDTATVEELTQCRDLLREEIGNVNMYYNKLLAYNSELKAFRHKVLKSYQRKEEEGSREINVGVESTQYEDFGVGKPQPLAADHMADKLQLSVGPIAAQFYSSYNGLVSDNHVGPGPLLMIRGLNVSAEGTFGVDLSQPSDMRRDFTDRRARFAEARRRRMDIIKIKSMRSATYGIKLVRSR